ncbi:MAG: hypothetical protein ACK4WC_12365, partial [Rubrimonas sp.]
AERLAEAVGPYADRAGADAAAAGGCPQTLAQRLARLIGDPDRRRRFLEQACADARGARGPGLILTAGADAMGRATTIPPMRALEDSAFMALPDR